MNRRYLLILMFFLPTIGFTFGQGARSITFTTAKSVGEQMQMAIQADAIDRPDIWIDWNNNGIREEGEEVIEFGINDGPTYEIKGQTVTIYGNVKQFRSSKHRITSVDLTNNDYLTYIWLAENEIREIDLSNKPELVHLQLPMNQLEGTLDVSEVPKLQQLNIDRNNLEGLILGDHPGLFQLNISRNYFSAEAIDTFLDKLPNRVGASGREARLYIINTRPNYYDQYPEGNQVKQRHLDHPNITRPGNPGLNWHTWEVWGDIGEFHDITKITNYYNMSFSHTKNIGDNITLNINATAEDRPAIWIDLNGNGNKDSGEEVTNFGSDTQYTVGNEEIVIYGPVSELSAPDNEISQFNSSTNTFLRSLDLQQNAISILTFSRYNPLESLNIVDNALTVNDIDNIIANLYNRSGTAAGSLTLMNFESGTNNVIRDHFTKARSINWDLKDITGAVLGRDDIPLLEQTITGFADTEIYPGGEIIFPENTDEGLAVTYIIEEGQETVATLENNKFTAIRHGSVEITATQAGDDNYDEFSHIVSITIMPAGDVFNWLEAPALSVIGNNVSIVGPEEEASLFTKLFINDEEVEMIDGTFVIDGYSGRIEIRATNQDGSQEMRIMIEK